MGLAFWRSKKRAANAGDKPATRPPLSHDDDADARMDPAAGLRARARHRLIGASALLLAVAIVVPMLLDPAPKQVSENIPIDIPSERTPFAPRLSLPPVPAADAAGTPPPDHAPAVAPNKADAKTEAKADSKAEPGSDGKARDAATSAKQDANSAAEVREARADDARPTKADASRTAAGDEPRRPVDAAAAGPSSAKGGKFAVQAAAPASEKAARDLVDRLKKGGFTAYTEKVETKDGARYRVRIGPYATREEAEKGRARLKSQGINGNLVPL